MILAVADCAEGKGQPPIELEYAWQGVEHPGSLPNAGGLRDQPVSLMTRMRVALNVYQAIKSYIESDMSVEWTRKNHKEYEIFVWVAKLRAKKKAHEESIKNAVVI